MLQTNERLYLKRGGQIPEDDTRGSCLLASLIFMYTCIHTYVPLYISNIHEYMHMHSYTYTHMNKNNNKTKVFDLILNLILLILLKINHYDRY